MENAQRYVSELEPFIQSRIEMELRGKLTEIGLQGDELHEGVLLGMDSQICDLDDNIDVQGVIQEGNEFLNRVSGTSKVHEVDKETIDCIINSVEYGEYRPLGVFYYKNDDGVYIGVDNSEGNAWVEEFKNEKDCLAWLGGAELEDGKVVKQVERDQPESDPKIDLYNQIANVLEMYDYGKADGESLAVMLERIKVNWHELTGVEPECIGKERGNKGKDVDMDM